MALNLEWKNRIVMWMEELQNHFYRELGPIELAGWMTREQLRMEEAAKVTMQAMPEGSRWGSKWEYGWFQGSIVLPWETEGKRVVFKLDTGAESTVFVNGRNTGALDLHHHEITLCLKGVPGQTYIIMAESYAGHGPRLEKIAPVPPERVAVPEPGATQAVVGRSTFGIWEEEAYQLWIDVDTLYQVRCNSNEKALRAAQIDKALKEFTLIVDFELPYLKRVATFKAGRQRLAPLLACVNGSTAPTMFIFGQSHLDLAWLWPVAETRRKCARTLSTQISYMDEYPEYRFLLTQPPICLALEEHYPELYQRVKEKIRSGQIMPEGGMWVEADTNLPGGESLIRHFLYGKRFFREQYGVNSELVWLPDCFGFSAALPQIMKGCGMKYFSSKKLFDNYNGGDPFPYNLFMWEGIDGSQVLAHLIRKSNAPLDPQTLIRRWEVDRVQKDDLSTFLFPFGYGDGGGGATRNHLEYARRLADLEGVPRTRICHPVEFFEEIERQGLPENCYVGELYFSAHRGTYTSQARTKRGNRQSEIGLREVEMWGAVASSLVGLAYPDVELEQVWKKVLFNQFHDILTGVAIRRVHEEAEADYQQNLETLEALKNNIALSLVDPQAEALTLFNSLGWDRRELVACLPGWTGILCMDGRVLPVQEINGEACAEIDVPACGWTTVEGIVEDVKTENRLEASEDRLENEWLRVQFNPWGAITGIYDKEAGREWADGFCNCFTMYKDVTTCYDAWDIDSMYEQLPVDLNESATIQVVSAGPLVAAIRVERQLNHSFMTQEISLRRGSRRVEFHTRIDWRENHKLLKVAFPVKIQANEAVCEIQFGHLRRPNHKSRQYDADRFEVCHHKWAALMEGNRGFAVLNDCKYGVNVLGGRINLTLLKAALAPDMEADRGFQEFTYAFYAWNGPFVESNLIQEAYELNYPVWGFKGAAGEKSLFQMDCRQIVIETVKLAEDRSGDLIIRMYESRNSTVKCTLRLAFSVIKAEQADMLENVEQELPVSEGQIALEFRPFEIKTLRVKLGVHA